MTNSQRLAAVRLRLEQWLAQNVGSDTDGDVQAEGGISIRGESILIRGGFYCGRQFDAAEYRAVWFTEEDELKISTRDGKWVCTLSADELVPAEVQPVEGEGAPDAVEEEVKRDVIAMPVSQSIQAAAPTVESADHHGSDEQQIRRAA